MVECELKVPLQSENHTVPLFHKVQSSPQATQCFTYIISYVLKIGKSLNFYFYII